MAGIRKPHTAWSACSFYLLAVFLSFHNPVFAEIKSVLLNSGRAFLNTDVAVTQLATFAGAVSINNFGTVGGTSQRRYL